MTQLYRRVWSVQVGDVKSTSLRVQFKAVRTTQKEPNSCDLRISNLSDENRGKLAGSGVPVVLSAGYENINGVLFSGDSRSIDHVRERADWNTHVQCGDGEQAYLFSRTNLSFSPGTLVKDAVIKLAEATGLNSGNLRKKLDEKLTGAEKFINGKVTSGRAFDALAGVLKEQGLEVSIQSGAIQVKAPDEAAQTEVYVLSPDTGLIGSPDHAPPQKNGKPPVVKFKSLLNANIKPGHIVRVKSRLVSGDFIPFRVEHSGDTHGSDWTTSCDAYAVNK